VLERIEAPVLMKEFRPRGGLGVKEMNIVEKISNENLKSDVPDFRSGDTVKVHVRIKEGEKERIQIFEGVCIARHRGGASASFTVRKQASGVGVERVFPLHSPMIQKIELSNAGRVRRSRLYYLRELSGKAARIKGRQWDGGAAKAKAKSNDAAKSETAKS